jgi:hypothetical protein
LAAASAPGAMEALASTSSIGSPRYVRRQLEQSTNFAVRYAPSDRLGLITDSSS